jgi:predicted secreted Zn-dependent protease
MSKLRKAQTVLGLMCLICTSASVAQPFVVETNVYSISSPSKADLPKALRDQTPKNSEGDGVIVGWTSFLWGKTNVSATNKNGMCAVDRIDLAAKVTSTSPRLVDANSQEWAVQFERFASQVRQHEMKHVRIFQVHFQSLTQSLKSMEGRSFNRTCESIQADIQNTLLRWPESTSEDHRQLDAREGHLKSEDLDVLLR